MTTYLILGLWIAASFSVVSTILMFRFWIINERLEDQNESLKDQLSKFQAREQSRKLEDVETLDKMFEDLEREELIFLNTQ